MLRLKKKIILLIIVFIPFFSFSIKFKFQDKNKKEYIIKGVFENGIAIKAVADGAGITDYEVLFIKAGFHFLDFGIGINLEFRFRFFLQSMGYGADYYSSPFRVLDWYIPEGYVINSGLNAFITYLDKIEYIFYGTMDSPFYFHFGENPYTTFGSGLLFSNFHNHSFLPVSRELGIFFKFNGNNLSKIMDGMIPIDVTFMLNDIADPDIFAFDAGINIFDFSPWKKFFDLRLGSSVVFDINSYESNRLSSLEESEITSHRNLTTTTHDLYTSFPLFSSIYGDFLWKHKHVKLNVMQEAVFLSDFNTYNNLNAFGFGMKTTIGARVVNLERFGYILGLKTGFIVESSHFFLNYFSSNYEILRKKQYTILTRNNDYTFYLLAGFGVYMFHDKIKFEAEITIPLITHFTCRLFAKFTMEDTVVPGLWFSVFYETGMNAFYPFGEGAGVESLTRDFRFAFEGGYNFFGAKISVIIGIQRPAWVIPSRQYYGEEESFRGRDPYEEIQMGYLVPNQLTSSYYDEGSRYENYHWKTDGQGYWLKMQKFVSVEISFVF